jgi:ribosomal protein S17
MKRIEKKAWPELFEKVLSGEKSFDLRLAEFECRKGDILVLREWDPKTKEYTGRELEKEITFVIKTKDVKFWSEEEMDKLGFIVMAFK